MKSIREPKRAGGKNWQESPLCERNRIVPTRSVKSCAPPRHPRRCETPAKVTGMPVAVPVVVVCCPPPAFIVPIERNEARVERDRRDNRRFRTHRSLLGARLYAFTPSGRRPRRRRRSSTNPLSQFLWIALFVRPEHTVRVLLCANTENGREPHRGNRKVFCIGHRWTGRKV